MGSPRLELSSTQPQYLYSSASVWGPIYFSTNPQGRPKYLKGEWERARFSRFLEYLCGLRSDFSSAEYAQLPQEAVYAGYALAGEINSVSSSPKVRTMLLERFVFEMRKGEWSRDMMSVMLSLIEDLGLSQGVAQGAMTSFSKGGQRVPEGALSAQNIPLLEEQALRAIAPKIISAAEKAVQRLGDLQPIPARGPAAQPQKAARMPETEKAGGFQSISARELVALYFNSNPSDFVPLVAPIVGAKETATVAQLSPLVLQRVSAEGPDRFARKLLEEIKKKRKEKYEAFLLELFGKRRSFRPDLRRILSLVVKKQITKK